MNTFARLKLHLLLLIFIDETGVLGFVDMTCNPTDTAFGQASICTCTTDSGTGIAWQKDGTNLIICFNGGSCDPPPPEYENGHSTSGGNEVFTLTIKAFGYSSCAVFSCKDQDTTDTDSETLILHEFNGGVPSITNEPGSGSNGLIEITTDCLFKERDINVNWYAVDGSSSKKFTPETSFMTSSPCSTKVCSGDNAVTLNIGFTHTEKSGKLVNIKVEVYHSANSSTKLEWTTTDKYRIEADCTCECKCKCKRIVIPSIVFGSLGMINLPVVIGGTVTEHFGRTTALIVDFIGIVCDVTSFVLGIVVQIIDCCEDCCEDSDCCECERNWIENTGAAFIAIGALVGILAGFIFHRVWSNRMGPGNNGGNGFFCFNNGNDGGDDGGNDGGNNGHHRGHGTNSSTVHSERADTHRGTLSDRANSEGEVSRKDVHVQEKTGDNFSGRRPMPPIPLTDKKGRGLSANYDDEHPMISVGIPDKKAGDLGPLEEESKKKKKKKKKTKNDGDEREKEENKE